MDQRQTDGVVAGRRRAVDEAARDEGGQAHFVRTTLHGEAPSHDRERALGVGAVDARGQREVRAQAVVARMVVELGVDAHVPLAGAQLERGADLGADGRGGTARAFPFVADRMRRQFVRGRDQEARAHRARLQYLDRHRLRSVDDSVVRRR